MGLYRMKNAMKRLATLLVVGYVMLGLTACVYSVEDDVAITPAVSDDEDYSKALAKATKERTVFVNFETRYHVTATYLSPEFLSAFSQRMERVYKKGDAPWQDAKGKAAFFVSVNAPNDDRTDLSNPNHWTVLMAGKDGSIKPIVVKKLSDKERWRAFFFSVTDWTKEYLVIFDAPAVNANSPELVEKTSINLTFANADGQVNLTW